VSQQRAEVIRHELLAEGEQTARTFMLNQPANPPSNGNALGDDARWIAHACFRHVEVVKPIIDHRLRER
jgi:hypothetical protein